MVLYLRSHSLTRVLFPVIAALCAASLVLFLFYGLADWAEDGAPFCVTEERLDPSDTHTGLAHLPPVFSFLFVAALWTVFEFDEMLRRSFPFYARIRTRIKISLPILYTVLPRSSLPF